MEETSLDWTISFSVSSTGRTTDSQHEMSFWHPGTLTLSPERQSARMSKIFKWRLNPICHRVIYSCTGHMATVGVKGSRTCASKKNSVIKPSNCNNLRILLVYTLVIQTVACSEVIYVRPTVNTVFIDKHCCSSVLMLRPHCLEQSSLICTHCWPFH